MKTLIRNNPFKVPVWGDCLPKGTDYFPGLWPAKWIRHPEKRQPPFVHAFRCRFTLKASAQIILHVSADERYLLYLDGRRIGRGPERGDQENWFFDTYREKIDAGPHTLAAIVWSAGSIGPSAQITVAPGFLLAAGDARMCAMLNTGVASWESCRVDGIGFLPNPNTFLAGNVFGIDAAVYPWGVEGGAGIAGDWIVPAAGSYARSTNAFDKWGGGNDQWLRPSLLPAMLERPVRTWSVVHVSAVDTDDTRPVAITPITDLTHEHSSLQRLVSGESPVRIPPHTRRRVLIDLNEYYCAYTHLIVSGGKGATVRIGWAEALYTEAVCYHHTPKGNRDEIAGKFFSGACDTFTLDGGDARSFEPLWWKAGRFVEVYVNTQDEALTINTLLFTETRYPVQAQSTFSCDDDRLEKITPVMVRSLQMCSHETFMDCPYYEQLMYIGDTRLQALVTMVLGRDDRLVRKALEMFAASRRKNGLTRSCYPARGTQMIPTFSLWWCAMLHDFALWRGDRAFIAGFMPMARDIIDIHIAAIDKKDGLFVSHPGWNYMDWTRGAGWDTGVPPDGKAGGKSAMANWQLAGVLMQMARLEEWMGERELAARDRRIAGEVARACVAVFWNEKRGLFADDRKHRYYSEHTQCLALLSGLVEKTKVSIMADRLCADSKLTRTTIYFSHYLFDALAQIGRIDKLFDRLQEWYDLVANGMKTTRENPEPTRSDCHAWGAHPLFHYYASITGIRPAEMGFGSVAIRPQFGHLNRMKTSMVHPGGGSIVVDLRIGKGGSVMGSVVLPGKVGGVLIWKRKRIVLKGGRNVVG